MSEYSANEWACYFIVTDKVFKNVALQGILINERKSVSGSGK